MSLKIRMATVVAGALLPVLAVASPGQANHIVASVLVGLPSGGQVVNFTHVEKESGLCCGGAPSFDFGDGTIGFTPVTINQATPPGVYMADLYTTPGFVFLGTFPMLLDHPTSDIAATPVVNESTTRLQFAHTYPATGLYTVRWADCCLGSPQIHPLVQPTVDGLWYGTVVPLVGTVQSLEPVGVSGGTTEVLAL